MVRSLAHARGGDERGIALQTIIIMVVLLAIAGAVAAVLLTRAGEDTTRLEEETTRWDEITDARGCEIAGGRPSSSRTAVVAISDSAPFVLCHAPA